MKNFAKKKKYKLEDVSKKTGIPTSTLNTYENDPDKDIPHRVIICLAEFYGVSTDYLLGLSDLRSPRNEDLQELKINDDTIDLLKSDKLNNPLLCEVLTDPGFEKLLTDMEIYAHGLASVPLQTMNPYVDTLRQKMINGEDDLTSDGSSADNRRLEMLKVAHLEMDDYFFNILHKDLDAIASNLREKHKDDPNSITDNLIGDMTSGEIKRVHDILTKTGDIKKALDSLLVDHFAATIGMRSEDLSKEKKDLLLKIFHDSPRYKKELKRLKRVHNSR